MAVAEMGTYKQVLAGTEWSEIGFRARGVREIREGSGARERVRV